MKRIKSFLYDGKLGSITGLKVGQVIPPEWLTSGITHQPMQFSAIRPGEFWWVTDGDSCYGWCELEEVPAAELLHGTTSILQLAFHAGKLGPRALALLVALAERLAKGAVEHGDFEAPAKPLVREALEEHLDAVIYLAKELQDGEASRG